MKVFFMDFNKDNITILLPCFNEEAEIAETIRHYKCSLAKRSKANVIHSNVSNGFLLAVLRDIYCITTDMVVIIDLGRLPRKANYCYSRGAGKCINIHTLKLY
jgi:hypothetical protein